MYHPFWDTLHWVLVVAAVGIVLRINASSFDETEIKSIAQIAVALAGLLAGRAWITRRKPESPKEEE